MCILQAGGNGLVGVREDCGMESRHRPASFVGGTYLWGFRIAAAMDGVFGASSCLCVKYCTAREFCFLFFRGFLLVLMKPLFWGEDCALGYNSMEF